MIYVEGLVQNVVYSDEANSFYIFKMRPETSYVIGQTQNSLGEVKSSAVFRGKVIGLDLKPGAWVPLKATQTRHKKYGIQYQIEQAPFVDYWTDKSIQSVLKANGVSHYLVRMLVKNASDRDLPLREVLRCPQSLENLGMTQEVAESLYDKWSSLFSQFKALSFIHDIIPTKKVRLVWNYFQDDVKHVLTSNPWRLLELGCFNFAEVDKIALSLGFKLDDSNPSRIEGSISSVLNDAMLNGHLHFPYDQTFNRVRSFISSVSRDTFQKAVDNLLVSQRLKASLSPDRASLYLPKFYDLERESADLLLKRRISSELSNVLKDNLVSSIGSSEASDDPIELIDTLLDHWSRATKMNLSDKQREGVHNAVLEPISVITGLPGTGKTTSLRMVVRVLKETGTKFLLLAPTGIAAKRITSITGESAATIHRAFGASKIERDQIQASYIGVESSVTRKSSNSFDQEWEHSPSNPHPCDVVIVDESSMLDQHLLYRILYCTKETCRLVFVGDSAQLPSVGAGNVLSDLISSGKFPTVHLSEIFRQDSVSDIIKASHAIHKGEIPSIKGSKEFVLFETSDAVKAQNLIESLVHRLYRERLNFQVLSPRHGGSVGVTNLNSTLRSLLNPKSSSMQELKLGGSILREEDRIMVVKNNYDLGIYNGDVGKISRISQKSKEIEIKIHGPPVMFVRIPMDEAASTIRLAYAMTVHKSQGQEYDNIIMPIMDSFGRQLQRNLLYTAVTRAKQRVFLVGTPSALRKAIRNNKANVRQTFLMERLTSESLDLEIEGVHVGDLFYENHHHS